MDEVRKKIIPSEVADPKRQIPYVFAHMWMLPVKSSASKLQYITTEVSYRVRGSRGVGKDLPGKGK